MVVVLHSHRRDHHRPDAAGAPARRRGGRQQRRHHGGQGRAVVAVAVEVTVGAVVEPLPRTPDLLGLLHGEREGLDWSELEAKELVLMLLSGLLREHTRSMDTLVFLHASHAHSALHLRGSEVSSLRMLMTLAAGLGVSPIRTATSRCCRLDRSSWLLAFGPASFEQLTSSSASLPSSSGF
ncbi:hypothetical protein EYF80_015773 [Liparis tanakae]|uniref:Uncharacterized protein n=1 Tax=Liparis tanakae TaxID=230148 RepID=A0A4Z2I9Z7_9TELE|nr:hypothetical protein EYF80_015773 [Liparis tanakae]